MVLAATAPALGVTASCSAKIRLVGGNGVPAAAAVSPMAAQATSPSSCELDLDFGRIRLGQSSSQNLTITDVGSAQLTLESLTPPADLAFSVALALPKTVTPGNSQLLSVTFQPSVAGPVQGSVVIVTDTSACPNLTLAFKGVGESVGFTADPYPLDFGNVLLNTQVTLPLKLTNTSSGEAALDHHSLNGQGAQYFSVAGLPDPSRRLMPNESVTAMVTYSPGAAGVRDYGDLVLQTGDLTVYAPLLGHPVAGGISFSPNPMDFGHIAPGACTQQTLTLTNIVQVNLSVTSDTDPFDNSGPFKLGAISPPIPFTLKPGDVASVPITFCPTGLSGFTSVIGFDSSNPNDSNPQIPLQGFGGGPQIRCTPSPLAFGDALVGLPTRLTVTCTNVGDLSSDQANLSIRGFALQGAGFSAALDPATPFANSIAPGKSVMVDVTFTPTAAGPASGTLVVQSNGGTGQDLPIALSGTALKLLPCQSTIAPGSNLSFGNVPSGGARALQLLFSNVGTDICLVSRLELSPAGAGFDLVNAPAGVTQVPPGGTLPLTVQFRPTATGIFAGELHYSVSSSVDPNQTVVLSGSSVTPCLEVRPARLDFGKVGPAGNDAGFCQSAGLNFTVFNSCAGAVSLPPITVQGSDSTPQFAEPQGEVLPGVVDPGAHLTFTQTFAPTTAGSKVGQLVVSDPSSGAQLLVDLSGSTSAASSIDDSLVAALPKVDLLLDVQVDSLYGSFLPPSGAATSVQTALGAFIASASNVDWRIALTTDVACPSFAAGDNGRLLPCPSCSVPGAGPLIADRTTRNGTAVDPAGAMAALVGQLVPVANTCLSCEYFESIRQALALGPTPGVDFFRPGALLGVLSVTDDLIMDSSSQATGLSEPIYEQLFQDAVAPAGAFSWNLLGQFFGFASSYLSPGEHLMLNDTGGLALDSTSANWAGALGYLASSAAAQQSYLLSSLPSDLSQLTVRVGGAVVAPTATGGTVNWIYDRKSNAVRFAPAAAPAVGTAIDLAYPIGCP